MVVFVLAAAAALLLCILLRSSKRVQAWLDQEDQEARAFQLIFMLSCLAAAVLVLVLIVAAASYYGVMVFLFSLPTLFLIYGRRSLLKGLVDNRAGQADFADGLRRLSGRVTSSTARLRPSRSLKNIWRRFWSRVSWSTARLRAVLSPKILRWFWVISPLLPWVLLGHSFIVALVPDAIVFRVSETSPAFLPVVLSACVAILAWLAAAAVGWTGMGRNRFRDQWQTWLVFGSLVLIAILSTLMAGKGDAWAYAVLLTIRRVTSMPETTYAVLGAVAGFMCGNFSRWMSYARSLGVGRADEGAQRGEQKLVRPSPAPGLWPVLIFGGALSFVVLAALLAPYAQGTLSRLSSLEMPYLKVQFAISPAEKQQVLNVERDLVYINTIEEIPRSFRFIQYDCAQAALDAGKGITEFRRDRPEKYLEFTTAIAFQQSLLPYVNQLVSAKRKGHNRAVLNARARQVAEKFALLATKRNFEENDRSAFEENYRSAMSEIERQEQLFKEEGVRADLPEEEKSRRRNDPDPEYCWPSDDEIKLDSDRFDIRYVRNIWTVVQKRPRPILDLAAALFHFAGDTVAANAMRTHIFHLNPTTDDINTVGEHATAQYIEGEDLGEVIRLRQADLQVVESRLERAERAQKVPAGKIDTKAYNDLVRRYDRGRFQVRLRLAYVWAQHGLAAESDLLPERDLHWSSAQKYADDAYQAILDSSKSPPRFMCLDQELDLRIKDTYAFVKLAYQAYNLKTQRKPPDDFQVRQAREILEDALAEARQQHRLLLEAGPSMARGEAAPSCLILEETKAWIKLISSHLRLADALQL
jgi:hypothetical protein